MGRRLIRGFLLGGLVAFIWLMISWMVLPWHCAVLGEFKSESAVANVILENTEGSGVYMLPNMCDTKADIEANQQELEKGPLIFVALQRTGFDYATLYPFITGLIIQWVGAFFIVLLLLKANLALYWSRVWFVTLFGLTIGILGILPAWNWMGFSFGYCALEILDSVIAWWLAGLVMAAVAAPAKKS